MSKKTLAISLSLIILVAAAVVVGIFVSASNFTVFSGKENQQLEERLYQYFAGIEAAEYEALYEMLSEQSQEKISKADFVSKNQKIYGGIDAENITVSVIGISQNGDGKAVEYALRMDTAAGEISHTNYAVFTANEEKEYGLEWAAYLIFPGLNDEDKVRVNTLTAVRGNIYDRNGQLLAGEGTASSIGFVPGKMQEGENREQDIAQAAELLDMTVESINKKLDASYVKEDTFVPLRTVAMDQQVLKEELLNIPGIKITDQTVRYYPLAERASHLVGYIQNINGEELEELSEQGYHMNSVLGKAGVEKLYEEQLRAVDGCEIAIVDEEGNYKEILARQEKQNGEDVVLTIDARIQTQLYDQFEEDKSCSVAMNPETGEVLALVSTPSYNANDFVLGMTESKWTSLNEDEDQPMFNRFKAALCPGSTFKPVTAAIGIDSGKVSPDADFGYSGLKWRKDESWGGYWITTTMEYDGPADIENALKYSDNIYFAKAALEIGADLFAEELIKLGFEGRIPFEFGLYSSTISSTGTFTSEIQLADSGFGQGEILVNPIHLAGIYSAFVNEGSMIQPYLLLNNRPTSKFWKENVFTAETARILQESLIAVITSGSAEDAQISGITLAGKTGTAEIKQSKEDGGGTELGWFAMFTADDSTEEPLLVISMAEDVKDRGGSHYVVPRVRTVFEQKYLVEE